MYCSITREIAFLQFFGPNDGVMKSSTSGAQRTIHTQPHLIVQHPLEHRIFFLIFKKEQKNAGLRCHDLLNAIRIVQNAVCMPHGKKYRKFNKIYMLIYQREKGVRQRRSALKFSRGFVRQDHMLEFLQTVEEFLLSLKIILNQFHNIY